MQHTEGLLVNKTVTWQASALNYCVGYFDTY